MRISIKTPLAIELAKIIRRTKSNNNQPMCTSLHFTHEAGITYVTATNGLILAKVNVLASPESEFKPFSVPAEAITRLIAVAKLDKSPLIVVDVDSFPADDVSARSCHMAACILNDARDNAAKGNRFHSFGMDGNLLAACHDIHRAGYTAGDFLRWQFGAGITGAVEGQPDYEGYPDRAFYAKAGNAEYVAMPLREKALAK
jgi:hypothetical protein